MATGAAGAASLSLTVRLIVGQPAPSAQDDSAGNPHAILPEEEAHALSGALLHPAALSAVAGSAKRLLALAGASPGADVGVLSRAMAELERLAAGGSTSTPMDRAEPSTSSTAADMDIDSGAAASNQLGGGAKRKRDARRGGGVPQRPAKRRILAWRVRQYRSSVAKAKATARRARSRRAQARPMRRKAGSWKSVQQQLARATLSDGLHRWSAGGGGGGPAEQ